MILKAAIAWTGDVNLLRAVVIRSVYNKSKSDACTRDDSVQKTRILNVKGRGVVKAIICTPERMQHVPNRIDSDLVRPFYSSEITLSTKLEYWRQSSLTASITMPQ